MACATLYIISKVLHTHKELKTLLLKSQDCIKIENDDSETKNNSLKDISYLSNDKSNLENSNLLMNIASICNIDKEMEFENELKNNIKIDINTCKEYNPFCRNPLYAGITKGSNTELVTLSKHYHPSVALFANTILEGIALYKIIIKFVYYFNIIFHLLLYNI